MKQISLFLIVLLVLSSQAAWAGLGLNFSLGVSYGESLRSIGGRSAVSPLGSVEIVWRSSKGGEIGFYLDDNLVFSSSAPIHSWMYGMTFRLASTERSSPTLGIKLDPLSSLFAIATASTNTSPRTLMDYISGVGIGIGYRIKKKTVFIEPGLSFRYYLYPYPWSGYFNSSSYQRVLTVDLGLMIGL